MRKQDGGHRMMAPAPQSIPPLTALPPGPGNALPEITEAHRIRLEPGELLIIRTERELDMHEANSLREAVWSWAGEIIPVLILPPDLTVDVVTPAEAAG